MVEIGQPVDCFRLAWQYTKYITNRSSKYVNYFVKETPYVHVLLVETSRHTPEGMYEPSVFRVEAWILRYWHNINHKPLPWKDKARYIWRQFHLESGRARQTFVYNMKRAIWVMYDSGLEPESNAIITCGQTGLSTDGHPQYGVIKEFPMFLPLSSSTVPYFILLQESMSSVLVAR